MRKKIMELLLAMSIVPLIPFGAFGQTRVEKATFAGGCFWCMESPFEKLDGVIEVVSGYTGGSKIDPTYKEVTSGSTGHVEAIQITYDPSKVTYEKLLDVFWKQIDPTDAGGQFVDRGSQYKTAIFYHSQDQKHQAQKSKERLNRSGRYPKLIVSEIRQAERFYKAEDYHQDYYKTSPLRYKTYRWASGRDQYLEKVWGQNEMENPGDRKTAKKPDRAELKKKLSPLQYHVTQEDGTERAFTNEYWDNKQEGIYVDIVSGEPLFSSSHKFDSGTGWPSFYQPLVPGNIVEKEDNSLFSKRIEVRSKQGDSHLGHVFNDGPQPTGQRYCINSAALRFISKKDLEQEGYGKYLHLFN